MPDLAKLTEAERTGLASSVLNADIVKAPDENPANPSWTLASYIRTLFYQNRETQKALADLSKAVADLTAKVDGPTGGAA